jgi:serine/threonine protein kinase
MDQPFPSPQMTRSDDLVGLASSPARFCSPAYERETMRREHFETSRNDRPLAGNFWGTADPTAFEPPFMRIASWNDDQPTTIREGGLHGPVAAHGKRTLQPTGGLATAVRDAGIVDIATARRPPPLPADAGPRHFGPYLIYERTARGSLSWVHLGCGSARRGDRKLVAIKLLDPQAACDPAVLAMLLHEARLGSQIRHPNVVRTLDLIVDPEQGRLGLVTEYIQGESLARLVRRSARLRMPVPIEHAAGIVVAVLRGLQAVHEATGPEGAPLGIVHRDVSPQNIVVAIDGGVRLIDLGIATCLGQRLGPNDRRVRGKPRYMAPEQIRGDPSDRRVDIFAAGVVLWELLAGCRLFDGQDPNLVWSKILHRHAPPPSRVNPAVPSAVDAIVLHALARDREDRFAAASDFADAIVQATAIARPDGIARWVRTIAPDLVGKQLERAEQILTGARHRPRLPSATPLSRRMGQLAGLALVGLALSNAAVRNNVSLIGLLRAVVARGSAPRSQPPPVSPSALLVRQLPAQPVPPPVVTAHPTIGSAAPPPRRDASPPLAPMPAEERERPAVAPATPAARRRSETAAQAPVPTRAAALARILNLNRRAETAYRDGEFAEARRLLRSAVAVSATGKLGGEPQSALTHALLAAVLVKGYRQDGEAIREFRRALLVPRFSPAPSLLDNPDLVDVYEKAVASLQPAD